MSQELVKLWMEQDPCLLDAEGLQAFLEQQMPKQIQQEEKIAQLQPVVILEKILQEIHHKTHESYSRCWDTIVELIAAADFKGLYSFPLPAISTTTQHKGLMDKCHYMLDKYIEKARITPDDHLGELWNKMELRGNDGQCLTPMNVCDMITQMTIGGREKSNRIETVLEPAFGTGRFYISLNNLFPPPCHRFVLFAVEINISWYRAGCVNMKLFSKHPYTVICGDTLRLPHTANCMHPIWDLGNKWVPPDMTPFYEWNKKKE